MFEFNFLFFLKGSFELLTKIVLSGSCGCKQVETKNGFSVSSSSSFSESSPSPSSFFRFLFRSSGSICWFDSSSITDNFIFLTGGSDRVISE